MTNQVDARGLSCPQPVVMTKKALEELKAGTLDVLVDNKASSENVARFVTDAGCTVDVEESGGIFTLHITKGSACGIMDERTEMGTVVFISSDTVGSGNDELGTVLMRSFIPTLLEIEQKPGRMIFMNSGVKLTAEGSPVLEFLEKIEKDGVEMMVCGTCLDFFGLKEKRRVGRISNMFEIVSTLSKADKVIRI